jgi:RecB family endonuclease NucS
MRLYSDGANRGVEFPVKGGRIDLLAVDREGKFVAIELKLSRGRNKTLGQLLYYMSWIDSNLGNGPCRGLIIASEIDEDLRVAIRRAPLVQLAEYSLSFAIKPVERE